MHNYLLKHVRIFTRCQKSRLKQYRLKLTKSKYIYAFFMVKQIVKRKLKKDIMDTMILVNFTMQIECKLNVNLQLIDGIVNR